MHLFMMGWGCYYSGFVYFIWLCWNLKYSYVLLLYYRRLKFMGGTFFWEGKGRSPRRLGWENLYLKLSNLQQSGGQITFLFLPTMGLVGLVITSQTVVANFILDVGYYNPIPVCEQAVQKFTLSCRTTMFAISA